MNLCGQCGKIKHNVNRIRRIDRQVILGLLAGMPMGVITGCAMPLKLKEQQTPLDVNGIVISSRTGAPISWDEMIADLQTVRIVYIGEKHTSAAHHAMQLRVIRAMHALDPADGGRDGNV